MAEALFEAYRSQDVEEVKRVVKAKHLLSDLDNAVGARSCSACAQPVCKTA